MTNYYIYSAFCGFLMASASLVHAQYTNDVSPMMMPPGIRPKPIRMSKPVLDEFVSISEPTTIDLINDHHIFVNPKQPTQKSPVKLFMRKYRLKVKPAEKDGLTGPANNVFTDSLHYIQLENEEGIRGMCIGESPCDFPRNFYLFAHKPGENYFACTCIFGVQFKEISSVDNLKDIFEQREQNDGSDVFTIPLNNMANTIYLMASIDENMENLEIVNVEKINGILTVSVKSKLNGKQFSFVPDSKTTTARLIRQNKDTGKNFPSLTTWMPSQETMRATKKFTDEGFRHWTTKDYETIIIAKFIELKNDSVILETPQGKRVKMKIDTLEQMDKEFIRNKK